MISTEALKDKEVINIFDGKSLGYVYDIEVNLETGKIEGIVIPAGKGFRGLFSKDEMEYTIPWEKVKTVGDDVILVDSEEY